MPWSQNAALDALNDAAFAYGRIHGIDAMLVWLENEASRHRVYRDIVTKRRAEVTVAVAAAPATDAEHEKTLDVLGRYADPANWRTTKRNPTSVMMADGGAMARARLDEIEGRDGDGQAA